MGSVHDIRCACLMALALLHVVVAIEIQEVGFEAKINTIRHELRECRQTLLSVTEQRDICESKAENDAHQQHLAQLTQQELDLARKELSIVQERLQVCEVELRSTETREHSCSGQLELAKAEASAAASREAEAERQLRHQNCDAIKLDLRVYRERAETAVVEIELLQRKLQASEDCLAGKAALEDKVLRAEAAAAAAEEARIEGLEEMESTREQLEATNEAAAECEVQNALLDERVAHAEDEATQAKNELKVAVAEAAAAKRALESLLLSLDVRERYEKLLKEHEKEWLPHWLSDALDEAHRTSLSTLSAVTHRTQAAFNFATRLVRPPVKTTHRMAHKVWELRIKPVVQRIPGSNALTTVTVHTARRVNSFASDAARTSVRGLLTAENVLERAIIGGLLKVNHRAVRQVARSEVIGSFLWVTIAMLVAPPLLAIASMASRRLFDAVRPGSASVKAPITSEEHQAWETKLGHRFSNLLQGQKAFVDPGNRLSWFGNTLASLLAAETVFKQFGDRDDLKAAELRAAADMQSSALALARAATETGVDMCVQAGPGRRSVAAAEKRSAELFAACLAAVYVDAEFDLDAARNVWKKGRGEKIERTPVRAAPNPDGYEASTGCKDGFEQ